MKKLLSVFLALALVFGAAGLTALAAAEDGLTIYITGGTGDAVGGALSFSSAAAMKESHPEGEAMLVDAGGFADSAVPIMAAAGYELIVSGSALTDYRIGSIAMGAEGVDSGAYVEKNGIKTGFVAVSPRGEKPEEEYYEYLQSVVTKARDRGAQYVVAIGRVEDAAALVDHVPGINVVVTYGEKPSVVKIPEGAAAEAEAAEGADAAPAETPAESASAADAAGEEAVPVRAVVLTVGQGFASIGKLSLRADSVSAENVDLAAYEALTLTENDVLRALEAAFTPAAPEEPAPAEEIPAEENPAEENPAEEAPAEEAPAEENPAEEVPPAETPAPDEGGNVPAEPAEEASPTDGEPAEEAPALPTPVAGGDLPEETPAPAETPAPTEAPAEETPAPTEAPAEESPEPTEAPAEESPEPTPEATPEATPEVVHYDTDEGKASPTDYIRGAADLKLDFDHPVSAVFVSDNGNLRTFDAQYYSTSNDGRTLSIRADVLNGWGDGNYPFVIRFSDGTADKDMVVSVSGSYTAPTATPAAPAATDNGGAAPAAATATPVPTAPALPTATPIGGRTGSTPATGDTNPLVLYIILLIVLAVALVAVVVLMVKKKKRQ